MCPSLIQIGSKTAEKNSAQTNRQTDTTKIMVTWPWTNTVRIWFLFLTEVISAVSVDHCVLLC